MWVLGDAMKIRRAVEDDRLALFKLACAMHAETDFKHFNFDPLRAVNGLGTWIHSATAVMLVADDGGEVVGMLAGSVQTTWFGIDKFASEELFYVRADRRGGRAGYLLMRDFVAWGHKTGAAHLRAGVATGSGPAAERLYEHFGMHHVGGNYSAHLEDSTS